jgi:hypothetical protein
MQRAPNPTAMNSALIAARNGLSDINSPTLRRYLARYERAMKRKQQQSANKQTGAQVPIRSFDDK